MGNKKTKVKKKNTFNSIFVFVIILIILGIIIFKQPSITGKVVQTTETIYSENLNIQKNESGVYEWNIKNPGSIKSIKATGSVTSNGTARVYIENNGTRYVLFDSTKHLFDVNVNVLPEDKKILQGEEILMQIALLNLRGFGSGDVNVKYSIKDNKGNLVASQQETVFVETQAKFVRKLLMPVDIKPGTYIAFVEASTDVVVGSGSDTFEVMGELKYTAELKYYLIGFAALVAVLILFILATYGLNRLKQKKEIAEIKEKLPLEKIEKLEKELKALEEAYKAKFISQESFERDKKRLEDKIEAFKTKNS